MLKALIFDVDGTIAETELLHLMAFNQAFERNKLGFAWSVEEYSELLKVCGGAERIYSYLLNSDLEIEEEAAREIANATHRLKTEIYKEIVYSSPIHWRAGVLNLMEDAVQNGVRLAIATTTQPGNIEALIKPVFGAKWKSKFASIGHGENVLSKKPNPAVYKFVLKELGISPDEAFAFEDSNNGLIAAHRAKIATFITKSIFTKTQDFTGAYAVADDLRHLAKQMQCGDRLSIKCLKCEIERAEVCHIALNI